MQFVYINNFLIKKMGIRHVYHINIHCNNVKVIVAYYYLEDYFLAYCDTWDIGSV